MEYKFCSSQEEVENFLLTLREILLNPNFNLNRDFDILLKKKTEDSLDPYTTENTLNKLNYDNEDVKNELVNLKLENYVETLTDYKDEKSPNFYVFMKLINNKMVYIKVKIRNIKRRKVFCISFHFARFKNNKFPYKGGESL